MAKTKWQNESHSMKELNYTGRVNKPNYMSLALIWIMHRLGMPVSEMVRTMKRFGFSPGDIYLALRKSANLDYETAKIAAFDAEEQP